MPRFLENRSPLRECGLFEEYWPPGVLPSEEMVNGLYGPGLVHEAEALATAIIATIDKVQLQAIAKPPSPSIKS
ncbi:hypothetical protein A9K65_013980 [Mesorhizobium sp. WSM1497]|nr:hypothetical protein A9K65_013980 [Mesorhizobium sp. WSM1497]